MFFWKGNGYWVLLGFPFMWGMRALVNYLEDDPFFYQEHPAPQAATFLVVAMVVWALHQRHLKNRIPESYDEETGEPFFAKEEHSCFYIPIHAWPWVLVGCAFLFPYWANHPEDQRDDWDSYQFQKAMRNRVLPVALPFAPFLINDAMDQRDTALSSTGEHLLYTLSVGAKPRIVHLRKVNRSWSVPFSASFSGVQAGNYRDLEPAFHPGSLTLYFASDRPLPGESEAGDFNLWRTHFVDDDWSEPEPLSDLNEEGNEFYPSVAADGTLFFTARREGGAGGEDLWMARPAGDGFETPVPMPGALNTEADEFNGAVHPDGRLFVFGSARPDGPGGGDLYFSRLQEDGNWSAAVLGNEELNTTKLDFSPFFQPDSDVLWFTSNRADLAPAFAEQDDLIMLRRRWHARGTGGQDIYRIRYDRDALFPPTLPAQDGVTEPTSESQKD